MQETVAAIATASFNAVANLYWSKLQSKLVKLQTVAGFHMCNKALS